MKTSTKTGRILLAKKEKSVGICAGMFMVLTILPLGVFATDDVTVLNIQYDEDIGDVVICDEKGSVIEDEEDEHGWYEDIQRCPLPGKGAFKVTTGIPLEMLAVDVNATLAGGDVSVYFVANVGTISGRANINYIALQNGDEKNFDPAPTMMSADTM